MYRHHSLLLHNTPLVQWFIRPNVAMGGVMVTHFMLPKKERNIAKEAKQIAEIILAYHFYFHYS